MRCVKPPASALFPSPHNDNHIMALLQSHHCYHQQKTPLFSCISVYIYRNKCKHCDGWNVLNVLNWRGWSQRWKRVAASRYRAMNGPLPNYLNPYPRKREQNGTYHDFVWGSRRERRKCEEGGFFLKKRCLCVACCTQRGRCNNCWMGRRCYQIYTCRAGVCSCALSREGGGEEASTTTI